MTTPPLLLGVALLLWGWHTDLLAWGIILGGLLEGARAVRLRFDLAQEDFNRLWNFCAILFLAAAVILFFAEDGLGTVSGLMQAGAGPAPPDALRRATQTALRFFQWLPLVFFPLVVAQAYSRTRHLPWRTFSLYLRRQAQLRSPDRARPEGGVNTAHPYLMLVLFTASVTRRDPLVFYGCLAAMAAWALWPQRSRRVTPLRWVAVLGVVLVMSFAAQWAFMVLIGHLQDFENRLLQRFGEAQFDLRESRTTIGAIGRLKGSGRIAWRVDSGGRPPPELLREAAFTRFRSPTWGAARRELTPVGSGPDPTVWRLAPRGRGGQTATVSGYSRGGDLLLALPGGTREVRDLPASGVETNRLAATPAHGLPGLVHYTADYSPTGDRGAGPDEDDLDLAHLPEAERQAIRRLVAELGLEGKTPEEAMRIVSRFFLEHFAYSIYQAPAQRTPEALPPLVRFLNETRQGHCEYFATATALLLRGAGIPTRYAVGFSVQERSGNQWIVRDRHAHAWCLAFLDGRWQDVDTTPPDWAATEAGRAAAWEPLYDWLSDAWYAFRRWQLETSTWKVYLFFGAVGALGYMGWRQLSGGRWRRVRLPDQRPGSPRRVPGLDSEFYALERRLIRRYGHRAPTETLAAWCGRLHALAPVQSRSLQRLVDLHYRLRFDPVGLSAPDREELRRAAPAFRG